MTSLPLACICHVQYQEVCVMSPLMFMMLPGWQKSCEGKIKNKNPVKEKCPNSRKRCTKVTIQYIIHAPRSQT